MTNTTTPTTYRHGDRVTTEAGHTIFTFDGQTAEGNAQIVDPDGSTAYIVGMNEIRHADEAIAEAQAWTDTDDDDDDETTTTTTTTTLAAFRIDDLEAGRPGLVTVIAHDNGPGTRAEFTVERDGEIVSTDFASFVPARFTVAAEAMAHALEITGWRQAI